MPVPQEHEVTQILEVWTQAVQHQYPGIQPCDTCAKYYTITEQKKLHVKAAYNLTIIFLRHKPTEKKCNSSIHCSVLTVCKLSRYHKKHFLMTIFYSWDNLDQYWFPYDQSYLLLFTPVIVLKLKFCCIIIKIRATQCDKKNRNMYNVTTNVTKISEFT